MRALLLWAALLRHASCFVLFPGAASLPGAGDGAAGRGVPGEGRGEVTLHQRTAKRLLLTQASLMAADPGSFFIPDGVHLRSWLGFLGGSVGVFGTLLTYEKARFKMKQRILCPYCSGSGVITCGTCCGGGVVTTAAGAALRSPPSQTAANPPSLRASVEVAAVKGEGDAGANEGSSAILTGRGGCGEALCATCGALGSVACVNCRGEGVAVPLVLQRKYMDIPADELDLALEEMGVAALAADYANRQARLRLEREVAKAAQRLANEKRFGQNKNGTGTTKAP